MVFKRGNNELKTDSVLHDVLINSLVNPFLHGFLVHPFAAISLELAFEFKIQRKFS